MSQFRSLKNDCSFWEPDARDPLWAIQIRVLLPVAWRFPCTERLFLSASSSRYLGLDRARGLRCQPSLSLARLERSPARPQAERLGRSGGRASASARSKHGGRHLPLESKEVVVAEPPRRPPSAPRRPRTSSTAAASATAWVFNQKMLLGCHQINAQTWGDR